MTAAPPFRIAELVVADPDSVRSALVTALPDGVNAHVAGTGAGTLITLEQTAPILATLRRGRIIARLQRVMADLERQLESPAMPHTHASEPGVPKGTTC